MPNSPKRILLVICLLVFLCNLCCGCLSTSVHHALDDYLQTDVPLTMDFTIFPNRESLDETTVEDYRCIEKSTLLFDDICFLLRCNYDEATFAAENDRFEEMGAVYREDLFQQPAWVMLFGGNYYEYALVDMELGSIVYIAAQTPSMNTFEELPEEYLPIAGKDEVIHQYMDIN